MKLTWRSELANTCTTAMEAAWLSPVLLLLSFSAADAGKALLGLPLFALLYAARFVVRYLTEAELDLGHSRTLLVYLGAGSLLLALKLLHYADMPILSTAWLRQIVADLASGDLLASGVLLTAATVVYVWWRALRVAAEEGHPTYFFQQFEIGLVAVVACTFLAGRAGLAGSFVPWIFWFFLWGLLAVAVTRLEATARNRSSSVESYWLPILIAVTVLVLLGGGVVSLAYSQEFVSTMQAILRPAARLLEALYNALVTIALVALLPIAYIIEAIIALIMRLLGPPDEQQTTELLTNPLDQLKELQQEEAALPPELRAFLRLLLTAVVLFVVVRLLQSMLRRRRRAQESDVEETHESIFSLAELWAGLRALWRRLLARLGIGRQKTTAHTPAPSTPEERAAQSVRQIYQRLLELAAGLGLPRPLSRTPYEYLGDLCLLLPTCQGDLAIITESYVRARYGLGATKEAEVTLAQQAWLSVSDEGRRLKEERARQRREELGGGLFGR